MQAIKLMFVSSALYLHCFFCRFLFALQHICMNVTSTLEGDEEANVILCSNFYFVTETAASFQQFL